MVENTLDGRALMGRDRQLDDRHAGAALHILDLDVHQKARRHFGDIHLAFLLHEIQSGSPTS
jgi:hypothetical protein